MIQNDIVSSWSCPPPPIEASRVLRVHKYRDPSKIRPVIVKAANDACERAHLLALPDARYVILPIESLKNDRMSVSGGIEFQCAAFEKHLVECDYLVAFVMTIGPDLDRTVVSLVDEVFEPLDALFLETAGWLTIESATRQLSRHLKQEFAGQGWDMSLRMGPGYEYPSPDGNGRVSWDLWQQKQLFEMFGDAELPVSLSQMCAMSPKMSRSGVFGLTPKTS